MDPKYSAWKKSVYEDVIYWESPDKTKIAYKNGKLVELTWQRWKGGGVGPKPEESNEDYVKRRFSGSLKKREVRNLAIILSELENKYKQKS